MKCAHCNTPIPDDATLLLKANYRTTGSYKPKFPHIPQYVIVGDRRYHKGCW